MAAAGYTSLIVFFTWPLAIHLSTVLPHDLGDPLFGAYLLWWNAHSIPFTQPWWSPPFIWPTTGALAFSEHLLGLSVLGTPLQWLGASPITAYNIIFLLSFPLAALGAHALAFKLTGRHDASVLAGLLFGFSPYRTAQLAHIQMLWTFWLPIGLLALHQYASDGRRRWLVLFGATYLGQAASNGYFLLFVPVLVGGWLVWFLLRRGNTRGFIAVVVASFVASLPLVPILLAYRRIHAEYSLERTFGEIRDYSADIMGFFTTAPELWTWERFSHVHRAEQEVFTGLTPIVLVLLVCVPWLARRQRRPATFPKIQMAFAAVALTGLAVAVSARLYGPWQWSIGSLRIVTVGTPMKPFTVAIWGTIGALLTSGWIVEVLATRSVLAFYVLAAFVLYVLCLGPEPAFNGHHFWYKGPYTLLLQLPGYDSIRVPSRFATLGSLCLAVAAALALVRLTNRRSPAAARALGAAACACALLDCWMFNITLRHIPPRIHTLEAQKGTAVIELPVGEVGADLAAMYRSIYHGMPVVNGYAGFSPAWYDILKLALEDGDVRALDALDAPLIVVVDPARKSDQWAPLSEMANAGALDPETGRRIFTFQPHALPEPDPSAARLKIQSATASAPVDLALLTDGDVFTHWDATTEETGNEWIAFDLGGAHQVSALMLGVGAAFGGHARAIAIDVSTDGAQWTTVFNDRGGALAVLGARHDARLRPVTYTFAPVEARFVRARQTGQAKPFHWSICEAVVLGR